MVSFEKRFSTLLVEKETPAAISEPVSDKEAFSKQLEPNTNPQNFDVPPNPEMNYRAKQKGEQLKKLHEWIGVVEQFVKKLNGLETDSIQSQLNSAECDTIFTSIARSETKKVSRIAQDLSGFAESLKSHLMSADTSI